MNLEVIILLIQQVGFPIVAAMALFMIMFILGRILVKSVTKNIDASTAAYPKIVESMRSLVVKIDETVVMVAEDHKNHQNIMNSMAMLIDSMDKIIKAIPEICSANCPTPHESEVYRPRHR